jgi:hypothetical protein
MREEGVHRPRTAGEHRPQLLAVHQLGDAAAGVANQVEMSSILIPVLESNDTKLCRSSRGVHACASKPAAAATRRNERRTFAASSAVPAQDHQSWARSSRLQRTIRTHDSLTPDIGSASTDVIRRPISVKNKDF